MKMKYIITIIFVLLLTGCIKYGVHTKLFEIVKPIKLKNIEWKEIFSLATLDKTYVAQGIEVYKNYLLYTVHKENKESILLIFNIQNTGELNFLFSTSFPKIATHVSDLSIYNNTLYGIDYASNNLYEIDIDKTIKDKKLNITNTIQTHLKRSGSIIVTDYKNEKTLFVSQFIISNKISVFKFKDLGNKEKIPLIEIDAKHYIQGLYEKDNLIYVSSNKYGIDPIFIINKENMIKNSSINIPSTIAITGPGKMIEDIVIFNDYIITSDEETNEIYISKNTVQEIIAKDN